MENERTQLQIARMHTAINNSTALSTTFQCDERQSSQYRILLKANQQDLSYIKTYVLDENDVPVPFADNTIEFEVRGAGTLNATGNGDEKSHVSYKQNITKAYLGKCLAIVQSGSEKGTITLTAKSNGLPDVNVEIEVE